MRLTNRMMVDNTLQYIQDNIERLDQLRIHAGSTKIFQKASDDTTTANASLSLNSSIAANQAYLDSAKTTYEWMDINEMALSAIEDLAIRALDLSQSGMPEVLDPISLHSLQTEFEAILNQAIDVANSQFEGDYVFAGTNIHIEPFTVNGPPLSVTYNGDDKEIIRNLGPSENVTVNVDGQAVYRDLLNSLIEGINGSDISDLEIVTRDIQIALDTLKQTRTINKARQRQVLSAIDQGEETDFSLQALLFQNEDVSLVEALKNLQQQEITYQTVVEVASRTLATMDCLI